MDMQSSHRSRFARLRTKIRRRGRSPGIKPRRLAVEQVEDRFLLSADFQAGMPQQLGNPLDNPGLIVIVSPSVQPAIFINDGGGESTGKSNVFSSTNTWPNSGGGFLLISGIDLPPSPNSPDKGMIDVARSPQTPNTAPLKELKAQAITGTMQNPAAPQKTAPSQTGVEGARGRSRVFDLAMANQWESKPETLKFANLSAGAIPGKSMPDALTSPIKIPELTQPKIKAGEVRLPNQLPLPTRFQPRAGSEQLPNNLGADARPEANSNAVKLFNASTDSKDSKHAPEHGRATSIPQTTGTNPLLPGTLLEASQSQPIETGSPKREPGSAALPAQGAAPSDQARQAVFIEMGQKPGQSQPQPSYVDANHRARLVGLAIVAMAGQFLSQRWSRLNEPSQTCLLPPRRRGSGKRSA